MQIHDDETLLIPDRPGNNHLDSIENIIANPNVDLIFFVPGSEEARERQAACRRGPERSRRLRAALLDEPRYGRNFSKSGRRRYGQMRKAASIRDQSDRTDVAWVDFVIMHILCARSFLFMHNVLMTFESPLARRDVILGRLAQGQSVVAAALALEFEVSEDAIRRDLRALAAEGRCRRVYGGALPLSKAMAPMAARMEEARDRKQALARKAASLVKPGQFVFIDSGSTNLALVSCLPEDFELTIATNSIDIAAAALRRSDLRLIMVGGDVNHNVGGCVDAQATLSLTKMNIDLGVVGACAVSPATGVSAYELSDATFKRTLLAASRKCLVVVTDEKLAARAPHRVAELKDIDTFVVEHDADTDALDQLAAAGCEVLTADPPA